MIEGKGQARQLLESLRGLPAEQMPLIQQASIEVILNRTLRVEALEQKRTIPEQAAALVQLLAAKSNDVKDDVLQKALTLYGLALDAREKGNGMAILSPDDEILHEVIGFEPAGVDQPQATT